MFRYIAFSWTPADEVQSRAAEQLEQALLESDSWCTVFEMSGHKVYMTGNARGINDAHLLPANQGVILGRLFRRGVRMQTGESGLELSDADVRRITSSDGRALVDGFWGRYVAFLPSRNGEARVLRDPTGALPCYRVEMLGIRVVLSWLEDLVALRHALPPPPDWEVLSAHIILGQVSGRATALKGVTQVFAGELAPVDRTSDPPTMLWSAAEFCRRPSSATPAEASRLLRDTVTDCVDSWASSYASFVLRLSGGVDSSILLGILSAHEPLHDFVCLNYHSRDPGGDERAYARLCAQRHGRPLIERAVDEDFRLEELLHVARTPLPFHYIGSMGTSQADAQVCAAHHASAVLNGAGGDQLFFEVQCTWPAADYLRLRGFDRGCVGAVLDAAHLVRVSFWKSLHHAMADRGFQGNPVEGAGRYVSLMQRDAKDAASRAAPRFVHPCWLAAQDLPIGKFHQLGMVITPFDYYNHLLREAAPERIHPLMSQPLVELCLSTPTYVLTQGGRGRGLARTTFADLLPREIATRRSKGRMSNYSAKVLQRNLAFVRELLLDGLLAKHGLLDRHRTEAALADRLGASTTRATEFYAWIACETWLRVATRSSGQARPSA
ncbi:MAG TPA: asparagine synthase C-terminal domain-containing protein [Roseateles sp.]|uniref:asparagine synthase C-terminal domain-containing protein n=1 Tax=Roseateles sp. TaxID=1971397 RepID=UPI002EDA5238